MVKGWDENVMKRDENYFKRWLRKKNTRYIIWVSDSSWDSKFLKLIESDLIETLNPLVNNQRPAPPQNTYYKESLSFIREIKKQVYKNRKKGVTN